MPDPSTPSPRRRDHQPARALPLATVVIISLSVAVAAIIGTVVVLTHTNAAPTSALMAASSPPPTPSPSAVATPSAEQLLIQIRDLRQRREVLVQQVQEPTVAIYNLKRFSDQGRQGVYEGILNHPTLGPSRCVLIADPSRLTEGAFGLKSFIGKLVKMGERPYTMTTSVRGALGETTRDSSEYVNTYEIAVDPEGDLRQLDVQLDTAEHLLEQSFPNLPEAQALPAERARRAEQARQYAAHLTEVEQAKADQKAADAERERKRIQAINDRIAALDADIAKLDAVIATRRQRLAKIPDSDRSEDLKQKAITSIQAEIAEAERVRDQIQSKKGMVGHGSWNP